MLVNRELHELDEILCAARSIHEQAIETVLVSMGSRGMLLVIERNQYLAVPPSVDIVNTIGAGDSAVAGFVYGLVEKLTLKESLVDAVAAETARTLRSESALCRKNDFYQLVPQITVSDILNLCSKRSVS